MDKQQDRNGKPEIGVYRTANMGGYIGPAHRTDAPPAQRKGPPVGPDRVPAVKRDPFIEGAMARWRDDEAKRKSELEAQKVADQKRSQEMAINLELIWQQVSGGKPSRDASPL